MTEEPAIEQAIGGTETRRSRVPPTLVEIGWKLLTVVHVAIAFAPVASFAAFLVLTWRVEAVIGHSPIRPMDDPFAAVRADPFLLFLEDVSGNLLVASLIGFAFILASTYWLYRKHASPWPIVLCLIFLAALALLIFDPGHFFDWFWD